MLVAYGPDGSPVVAEETPLEQIQQLSREHALHCPNCRSVVHVRGGPEKRTQLHFAHQRGECAWSTEGESIRHARGKAILACWLRKQFPQAIVTLEERLPEPNRIADIFVKHANRQHWAIEFQCAPLELDEWQLRHDAYRKADILDIWIIGNNRREKQEAFIEAIIGSTHEIMFLDPLITPPRIWLRWPVSRATVQEWQRGTRRIPSLVGWVGRYGYGATLISQLAEISLNYKGLLQHPVRTSLEQRTQLLHLMGNAATVDEDMLVSYLQQSIDNQVIRLFLIPLLRSYKRDPDLLRRWNYGRGMIDQPATEADKGRVEKAREWLSRLEQQGLTTAHIRELVQEIPFIGPYMALARYIEMLLLLID